MQGFARSLLAVSLGLLLGLPSASGANASQVRDAQPAPPEVPLDTGDATPWDAVPLWWGEASSVAISATQPGLVAATVDHQLDEFGRAAVYRSGTYGAEWVWSNFFDFRGEASPGSLLFAANGPLYSGSRGVVNRLNMPTGNTVTPMELGLKFNRSVVHQFATSRVPGSVIVAAVRGDDEAPGGIVRLGGNSGYSGWLQITPFVLIDHHGTAVAMHATNAMRVAAALRSNDGQVWVAESTNGGNAWQLVGDTLPQDGVVTALVYVDDTLLAAVAGHGVFARTGDAGWAVLDGQSMALTQVNRLHVDHHDPMRLLAATPTGLSVSPDGGASWQHAVGGTLDHDVRDVATDPLDADLMLLAVDGVGVMTSVNGGASFEATSTGINDAEIEAVAAHPRHPLQLAATVRKNGETRIVESFDGGEGWVMHAATPSDVSQLHYAPDGALWAIARRPEEGRTVYRRSAAGNWQQAGIDAPDLVLQTLGFAPDAPGLVWAGGSDTVDGASRAAAWRSHDNGASWTRAWSGTNGRSVASVGVVPGSAGAHVLVSTDGQVPGSAAQLRLSLDGGQGWTEPAWAPAGDVSLIELCTRDHNNGSAVLVLRLPTHPFAGESSSMLTVEELASGGVVRAFVPPVGAYFRSPQCIQEGDVRRVYMTVESDEPLPARQTMVRTLATAGGLGYFGAWDASGKQPSRANAAAFNASGLYLASNRGLHRNTVSVVEVPLAITGLVATGGRMRPTVTLSWTGGGDVIDVYRDGAMVASVPNTGAFSEMVLRRGNAIQYQVCDPASGVCSEAVTLSP